MLYENLTEGELLELQKDSYYNPARYISGRIIEYDIKLANISILTQNGILTHDQYLYYSSLPKEIREKEIGLMIRKDPSIYTVINNGILEYRDKFLRLNNIDKDNIVRIAKDAIYINQSLDCKYYKFDNYIEFRQKSISSVFINLLIHNICVFVLLNEDNISIDVKGLGDKYVYHQDYMLNIIGSVVYYIERSTIQDALNFLSGIIDDYIHRNLDTGYYRTFDSFSGYTIHINNETFSVFEVDEQYKSYIDINYNLIILRELWEIVLNLYNRNI